VTVTVSTKVVGVSVPRLEVRDGAVNEGIAWDVFKWQLMEIARAIGLSCAGGAAVGLADFRAARVASSKPFGRWGSACADVGGVGFDGPDTAARRANQAGGRISLADDLRNAFAGTTAHGMFVAHGAEKDNVDGFGACRRARCMDRRGGAEGGQIKLAPDGLFDKRVGFTEHLRAVNGPMNYRALQVKKQFDKDELSFVPITSSILLGLQTGDASGVCVRLKTNAGLNVDASNAGAGGVKEQRDSAVASFWLVTDGDKPNVVLKRIATEVGANIPVLVNGRALDADDQPRASLDAMADLAGKPAPARARAEPQKAVARGARRSRSGSQLRQRSCALCTAAPAAFEGRLAREKRPRAIARAAGFRRGTLAACAATMAGAAAGKRRAQTGPSKWPAAQMSRSRSPRRPAAAAAAAPRSNELERQAGHVEMQTHALRHALQEQLAAFQRLLIARQRRALLEQLTARRAAGGRSFGVNGELAGEDLGSASDASSAIGYNSHVAEE
ncbi:unnamed protein product, partial [Prorocentrum cordatum]